MGSIERVVFVVVFIVLSFSLIFVKSSQWIEGYEDTAELGLTTQNTAARGVPYNPLLADLLQYFKSGILTLPASQACALDLEPPSNRETFNNLTYHSYYILYLVAPLSILVPVDLLWPSLTVVAFVGLLSLTYIFLRRGGVKPLGSLLFCGLISFHPAWSQSLAYGQFYTERLFIILGAIFIFLFVQEPSKRLLVLLFALLSCLVVEKMAAVIGFFVIGYSILNWNAHPQIRNYWWVGLGCVAYFLFDIHFVLNNFYYSSFLPTSLSGLVSSFSYPGFIEKLAVFLLFNFGMLGIFALFDYKAFAVALVTMLPNILGNVGGAEKTGWSTHYQTTYFPFLVWAAASGYVFLNKRMQKNSQLLCTSLVVLGLSVGLGVLNPYRPLEPVADPIGKLRENNAIASMISRVPEYLAPSSTGLTHRAMLHLLGKTIPQGARVSAPEFAYPALYQQRELHLFPMALEQADYAIVGAISYLGENNRQALENCLQEKMRKIGYDMDHPLLIGNIKVYRRLTSNNIAP